MAKRVKPTLNIPTVSSLEEADAMLARIAARKRELSLLELGLKEDVDALKLKCAEASEPIKQDIEVLEQALVRFGESKKTELFTRRRSVSLNFGILGFRASSSVKPMKKTTWEQVLGFLTSAKDSALAACIRTKREVDRKPFASFRRKSSRKWAAAWNRRIPSIMNWRKRNWPERQKREAHNECQHRGTCQGHTNRTPQARLVR